MTGRNPTVPRGTAPDVRDLVDAQRRGVLGDASFVAAVHRRYQAADDSAALDSPLPAARQAIEQITRKEGN